MDVLNQDGILGRHPSALVNLLTFAGPFATALSNPLNHDAQSNDPTFATTKHSSDAPKQLPIVKICLVL